MKKVNLLEWLENQENSMKSTKTYFMQDTLTGMCKIGVAYNPVDRLRHLQCGCPGELVLLGVLEGNRESRLHKMFKREHFRGEWFRFTDALRDFIQQELVKEVRLVTPVGVTFIGWGCPYDEGKPDGTRSGDGQVRVDGIDS